jgi:hypothetical protein
LKKTWKIVVATGLVSGITFAVAATDVSDAHSVAVEDLANAFSDHHDTCRPCERMVRFLHRL